MNGDIELEIGTGAGAGDYVVRVLRAAAGGEPVGILELDVDEVLSRRGLLEATVLASAVARRSVPAAEQPAREVGEVGAVGQLFQALFTGPGYGMYRASLGMAQQRGSPHRPAPGSTRRRKLPAGQRLPWMSERVRHFRRCAGTSRNRGEHVPVVGRDGDRHRVAGRAAKV